MAPGRAQLVPTCGRQRPTWRQRIILTASRVTPRPPPAIGPPRLLTARPAPPGAARSHTASDGGGYHRAPNPRSPLRLSAARSGKEGTHFRFRDASSSPALRNAIRRGRRDKKHRGERGAALRCVGWCCARRALRILAAGAATLWTEGMPWPRDRCLLKELRPYGAAQLRGFQSTAPRLSARCAPQELRAMQPLGHKSEP